MKPSRWTSDTIARWFAINIVVTVAICAAMHASFIEFAGVWARPGIGEVGLVDEASAIARVMDRLPRDARPSIASAARNALYTAHWYPDDASLPIPIPASTFHKSGDRIRTLIDRPHARIVAAEPGDEAKGGGPRTDYTLAIELSDGSWVQFTTDERSWGLGRTERFALIAFFVLLSSVVVAGLASRRLARPMEQFSRAAQRFGSDVHAPPMQAIGPREFRVAIDAFNDMQARVQRYVADRTDMLAAISHDLRAPLTRMRLRGEFIDDEEQQQKLFRDVDDMRAMVDSSLGFFRDDNEQESPTRFNLTELIQTVLDDVRDAHGDVDFEGDGGVIYIGRPLAFRRAIANLLDNAIKYGHRAHVRLYASREEVRIIIDDDGPGIAEALHETVFRPFYRIEPSRNRRTGGVGLGLGIARSAMRAHGGDIVLSQRKPWGLRVAIVLPGAVD